MTDLTINERLAVLETKMDEVQEDAAKRDQKQDDILAKLDGLIRDMASAKSFIGGVMWLGVAMVGVIYKAGPWLWDHLFSKKLGG